MSSISQELSSLLPRWATVWLLQTWAEKWRLLCLFPLGELGPHLTQCLGVAYLRTKWYPNPSSRLATIDMGRKVGAAVPLSVGELVSHLIHVARAGAYHHTKWHLDPSSRLATTDMSRKLGAVPLWGIWLPI